ncbi:hypothetical protein Ga0451573_002739 [Peptococcaceae bacterium DYL19]|nr:hypothetical protein [Phosphitispora fastidiosa]
MIKGLVINVLSGRKALYKVFEYFAEQDLEVLFGSGIEADAFNDDALGRALDKLAFVHPNRVYSNIVLSAITKHDIDFKGVSGFSGYLLPSGVNFTEEDDGNWSVTIKWDTVDNNVTAACEVLTKNTASDYNLWKWAHLANGENVQAWSAWQADGAPFNLFGPIVEFQSFYYWTPY